MDVCERPGPCLDLIRNHSALDAPCMAAGWVGVVGHRELAGVRGWPPAALPPEEQASGRCSCFAVRVAGAGLLGAPRKPL